MQINENLNLVLPVGNRYAYHTPISREVFEANYRLLAATKAALSSKGVHFLMGTGPQIAALTFRDEARREAVERGEVDGKGNPLDNVSEAFSNELKRLTTLVLPSAQGWDKVPVDVAIQRGQLDSEEWAEVESALTFFTCLYALSTRAKRAETVTAAATMLEGSSTSLSCTEWAASLPTLTSDAPSAPKAVSSVPS